MTTRLGFANGQPYEFHFRGKYMTAWAGLPSPAGASYVDLDTAEEYDAVAVPPQDGITDAWVQTIMGDDCMTKEFTYYDDVVRRVYICELCLHKQGQRLLAYSEGKALDAAVNMAPWESDGRYVVLGQANKTFVLDTKDASRHPIANSIYFLTNVSVNDPYIVLPEADGEVHMVDVRDWSDTNVTQDPDLQYMAASDGEKIVWVDYRFFPNHDVPEIAVYDIASKQMTRITDSTVKPSNKFYPTIEGDWVAWDDDRDSDAPNSSIDTPKDRLDIYGYNLKTKQEYHLVGNSAGSIDFLYPTLPRLHRGKLYIVNGSPSKALSTPQLFEFTLPPI